MQVRSFVAWVPAAGQASAATTGGAQPGSAGGGHDVLGNAMVTRVMGSIHVAFIPRQREDLAILDAGLPVLILGDPADVDSRDLRAHGAGGVPIRYDARGHLLEVTTSIVGMPPVYLYRGRSVIAITSDIHLLRTVPGIELQLDPAGVAELGHVGHPVEHRTLFRDLELVPAGAHLTLGSTGAAVAPNWQLPTSAALQWPQFLEAQMAAFDRALARTELSGSFLSLTAGLDTRTVFATLAAHDRLLPAATMTGARLSLDAIIARDLCNAHGLEHLLITFGDGFTGALPRHVESASLLSGGLGSLDQAPEVYLYDQLGSRFRARMSGNLGNQVGRGGTEGFSLRGAHLGILGPGLADRGMAAPGNSHWLLSHLTDSQQSRLQFILQHETVFTSVGNYSIGNHFAAQQSPYASRDLIETLALKPVGAGRSPSASKFRMQLRDLRHRFLGEPEERSFQRRLVKRYGGFPAQCPVNWGWKPSGGISPLGSVRGAATLVGMFARARGMDAGLLRRPLAASGFPDLHDFRDSRRWLRGHLQDYTNDTLGTQSIRDADLFDWNVLKPLLQDHFTGRADRYHTVVFALDVALAHRHFVQRANG